MPTSPSDFDFESPEPEENFDFVSPEPIGTTPSLDREPCPMCGEMIATGARLCRFCGEHLTAGGRLSQGRDVDVDLDLIKKFRREVHGVGGFWMFIAVLHVLIAFFMTSVFPGGANAGLRNVMMIVFGVFALIYFFIGLFTFLKQRWAFYVGFVFGYLGIAASLFQLVSGNICGVVIGLAMYIAVVAQTYRTNRWAGEMIADGIPLTAKPEDYR